MYLLTENTAEIACPVSVAYDYITNLETFGEWFPGVLAIESANELAHAVPGKTYLETVAIPLRGTRKVAITVVAAEPNKLLVTEGQLPPLMPRMEIEFHSIDAGACRVVWRMFSRNDHLLARITLLPLARRVMRKRAAIGMTRLARVLEGRSA
ncbi:MULTISPECIES: SRPBCC family protein [unclassified Pseudomonas]|uniref:SRPBCC family protein n=1 Tax=unclassified Pseudomonas TaxID=196821 RepID=UPI00244C4951|nr:MULTISPECIES: SRPBCC family protein [unclassified Pseudomonas]MDG9926351.1 SRPBCC family protein [Pseudomonas sp. GD04045]MDH0037600.1 SRPBCC family protein [Pseudomonas sp. GD04019]